jgi:hypothetical protein
MKTIWKFPFEPTDEFSLVVPVGAKFLSAQVQGSIPCAWFLVNPEAAKEKRYFRLLGTGHPFPDSEGCMHLNTFQQFDGAFVWHLFETHP